MIYFLASSVMLMAMLMLASRLIWSSDNTLLEVVLWTSCSSHITFDLFMDWAASLFLVSVFTISGSIYTYSKGYMEGEAYPMRFLAILSLFVLSMVLLIVSPSVVSMLLGWDGLGLSSYFLVLYYQSSKVEGAAMVTALSNRVGDVFMILTLILCLSQSFTMLTGKSGIELSTGVSLSLALSLAAITKSAQFPYCTWLPAAMAAPTPVSSLVHSSTLVTAGVYLLVRFDLMASEYSMAFLGLVCSFTLVIASLAALTCMDFKKIIALSTLSQLAFMGVSYSLGLAYYCFLHLITHAMFKSCLFMGAGGLIHLSFSSQDLRDMDAGLGTSSSVSVVAISALTLAGVPLLAAFFSKELILTYSWSNTAGFLLTAMSLLGILGTMAYTLRMALWVVQMSKAKSLMSSASDCVLVFSALLVLSLSVVSGWWVTGSSLQSMPQSQALALVVLGSLMILWSTGAYSRAQESVGSFTAGVNSFLFLAPFTLAAMPVVSLNSSDKAGMYWEKGWNEACGPGAVSKGPSSFAQWSLTYESISFKTVIKVVLLSSLLLMWLSMAKGS